MARARKRGAQRAVDQAADVTNYLSSCQFGITLASLGIGFLGEPAIASLEAHHLYNTNLPVDFPTPRGLITGILTGTAAGLAFCARPSCQR